MVLPCDLNRIAPGRNFRFVQPKQASRPARRVIAALSRAIIVAEAQIKSSMLHAARFALAQNKALACFVPAGKPASPGCEYLLQARGATPLRNPRELK
ncbi:MAG: DNA-processing protein DprA [bacterium]|nr:DNA-processing protein DprA [bacterium]